LLSELAFLYVFKLKQTDCNKLVAIVPITGNRLQERLTEFKQKIMPPELATVVTAHSI